RGSSLLGRAHHQGGWGRLSDDRPGQHNPDSSEDPWGGGLPTLHGGASARNRPDTERDIRGYDGMHEGRKQTNTWSAYAGSRLEVCVTPRWREMDSNHRYPVRRTTLFETPLSQHARRRLKKRSPPRGGTGRSLSWQVSSAFIRTGSTTG